MDALTAFFAGVSATFLLVRYVPRPRRLTPGRQPPPRADPGADRILSQVGKQGRHVAVLPPHEAEGAEPEPTPQPKPAKRKATGGGRRSKR